MINVFSALGSSSTTTGSVNVQCKGFTNQSQLATPIKPGKKMVEKVLDKYMEFDQRCKWIIQSVFYVMLLAIIIYDLHHRCPFVNSKFVYFDHVAALILLANVIYNIFQYLKSIINEEPIVGTSDQRILFNFGCGDNSFITTPLPVSVEIPRLKDPFIRERVIATNWKPQSRHLMQAPIIPKQPRYCLKKTTDRRRKSNEAIVSTAIKMSNYRKSVDCVNLIRNKKDLEQYLKEYSAKEFHNEPAKNQIPSHMTVKSKLHSMIGNTKYEYGPTTAVKATNTDIPPYNLNSNNGIGVILNSTEAKLPIYVTNLKRWMSTRILHKIVNEIDFINKQFKARGFTGFQVGHVGVEKLKQIAQSTSINDNIPMLRGMIPYLTINPNQEYLIQRIRELSISNYIQNYQSSLDTPYKFLNWNDHLPTDASIIFHLFCTFLDSQLPTIQIPAPCRAFYDRYVVIGDSKSKVQIINEINNAPKCAILCTNVLKPKFHFVCNNLIQNSLNDHNNLFYIIIQFLIHIKKNHNGFLEGINLSKPGIDILSILEDRVY